jgi:peptidoglycan L-alanyl-D-glutamate endopeptidase CwlK
MILTPRDRKRLEGVHPFLVRVVEKAAERTFLKWHVNEGVRTIEAQRAHLAAGRTMTLDSMHLARPSPSADGASVSHAVDLVLLTPAGKANWTFKDYEGLAAEVADAARICRVWVQWGGLFRRLDGSRFMDGLHFELDRAAYPRN